MNHRITAFLLALACFVAVPSVGLAQGTDSLVKSAYDRIEDYVNNQTFLVVRIDLTEIDPNALSNTLESVYVNFLNERGFSDTRISSSRREFRAALNNMDEVVEVGQQYRDTFGIREIFIVMQTLDPASVRIFIPGRQTQPIDPLSMTISANLGLSPVEGASGHLFTKDPTSNVQGKFIPSMNAQLKRFYENDAFGAVQIFCSTMSLETIYRHLCERRAEDDEEIVVPDDLKKTFDLFDQYFQNLNISIDVNNLTIKGAFVFTNAERAETARKSLETFVLAGTDVLARDAAGFGQSDETSQKYHLRPLAHSLRHASKRAVIPKRSANSLVFEFTPDSKDFWSNTCTLLSF
ncbi:MAG: hypothetical protein ACOX0A_04985 [Thermoguttaceae bacterium]|jgi:hypothetical protein